jgi:hypothetical protein
MTQGTLLPSSRWRHPASPTCPFPHRLCIIACIVLFLPHRIPPSCLFISSPRPPAGLPTPFLLKTAPFTRRSRADLLAHICDPSAPSSPPTNTTPTCMIPPSPTYVYELVAPEVGTVFLFARVSLSSISFPSWEPCNEGWMFFFAISPAVKQTKRIASANIDSILAFFSFSPLGPELCTTSTSNVTSINQRLKKKQTSQLNPLYEYIIPGLLLLASFPSPHFTYADIFLHDRRSRHRLPLQTLRRSPLTYLSRILFSTEGG